MAIRIDKAGRTGNLVSIKNTGDTAILQGQIVELGDYIEPDVYGATAVKALDSKKLVIHASVENLRPLEEEFKLDGEELGRGYNPETGQVFTLPKTLFEGTPEVKKFVEPNVGSQKWKVTATAPTATVYGEIIALETFAGQDCVVIHIYSLI